MGITAALQQSQLPSNRLVNLLVNNVDGGLKRPTYCERKSRLQSLLFFLIIITF